LPAPSISWSAVEPPDGFDFDRDGILDHIHRDSRSTSGAPRRRLQIISGETGRVLAAFESPTSSSQFGVYVARADDMNADGVPELFIADPGLMAAGGDARGRAYIMCGLTGEVIRTIEAPVDEWEGRFAVRVTRLVDVDGDGFADLCIWSEVRCRTDDADLRTHDLVEFPTLVCGRTGDVLLDDRELV
jgi:hypothetical protein